MTYKKDQLTPYVPDGTEDVQSADKSSDKTNMMVKDRSKDSVI